MFSKSSIKSRQAHHLDFIVQLTTDIRYIAGMDNVIVDRFSRIEEATTFLYYFAITETEKPDKELASLRTSDTTLLLKDVCLTGINV